MKQNIFYSGRIYIDCSNQCLESILEGAVDPSEYLSDLCESYPYTGTNLKDGQVVVEGKDYELQHQVSGVASNMWYNCDAEDYKEYPGSRKRIVAIPAHPADQPDRGIVITSVDDKKEETQEELWDSAHEQARMYFKENMTRESSYTLKYISQYFDLKRKPQ